MAMTELEKRLLTANPTKKGKTIIYFVTDNYSFTLTETHVLVHFEDNKIAVVTINKVKCDLEKKAVGDTCTVLWGRKNYVAKVLGIGELNEATRSSSIY